MGKRSKNTLSSRKIELYEKNAELIAFWRRNPCIAAEQLLGVKLLDAQKYILNQTWNCQYNVWACSRNYGKTFLGSVFIMLKWLLYENQAIYIIGSVGSQSIEMFKKIEDIAMQRISSSKSLKDIFANEAKKSPACKTGFTHKPASHSVFSYNESGIYTLNGDPDNIRSKRATAVFFDESAFSNDELLTAGIAFATQDTNFVTSTDDNFDPRTEKLKCPTQLIFASSMNDTDCLFYKKFKDYAINMFAGDSRNYFVTSMPCVIPLNPLMDGKPFPPLLKQSQIDDEMRVNPQKARREYYNIPMAEHEDQMIRQTQIVKNSTFLLPELYNTDNKSKYIISSDPARSGDNSILSVMKLCYDESIGYFGEVVNCINLIDITKKRKMSIKIPDQIKVMQETLLAYNGNGVPDYENIEDFLMDGGAGGQPSGFADTFIDDWMDSTGNTHKGFIDDTHELYSEEAKRYPNASRKFRLINPKKYRLQMCEEFLELMSLDLIKFPKEYNGKGFIVQEIYNEQTREIELKDRNLSLDEQVALINIDAMKSEVIQIHKFKDGNGNITRYANPNQHESDDRFYSLLLLAHKLYEVRRSDMIVRKEEEIDWMQYVKY